MDIDSHRIIDILDSRETEKVEKWLKGYPNLQIISRDGVQAYSSSALKAHPTALQISDRFHLLKNLAEAIEQHMHDILPTQVASPTTEGGQSEEMRALYNTRNRTERIRFAQAQRAAGRTINDIALLLHSSAATISRYLSIPESEIPPAKENSRERQARQVIKRKRRL